jgi:hypothetical protein
MSLRRANQELLRVRKFRNRRDPSWSIASAAADAAEEAQRVSRAGSAVERAWRAVAPEGLVGRAAPVSLVRGVLTIQVSDASARWEADRWLRAGGERELARTAKASIRKVKFVSP